jgi:hypothetical protein
LQPIGSAIKSKLCRVVMTIIKPTNDNFSNTVLQKVEVLGLALLSFGNDIALAYKFSC